MKNNELMLKTPSSIYDLFIEKKIELKETIKNLIYFIDFHKYKAYRIDAIDHLSKLERNNLIYEKATEIIITDRDPHLRGIAARILIEQYLPKSMEIIKWTIINDKHSFVIISIIKYLSKLNILEDFQQEILNRLINETSIVRVYFIIKYLEEIPLELPIYILDEYKKYILSVDINLDDEWEEIPEINKLFNNGFSYFRYDCYEMLKSRLMGNLNKKMIALEKRLIKSDILKKYTTPEMEDFEWYTKKRIFKNNYFTKQFQDWYFKELKKGKYNSGILEQELKEYQLLFNKNPIWRDYITKRFQDWRYKKILRAENE